MYIGNSWGCICKGASQLILGKKDLFYWEGIGLHLHRAKSSWYVLNESATQHNDGRK